MKMKKYIPHAEIPVVEHCNLNCSLCNSHAYLVENSTYPLEQFKKDIDVLTENVHFGFLTFLGGEPLLCENLEQYVAYAKQTKVAEVYRILSNGLLYKRLSPELMDVIDVIEISHYPQMKDTPQQISDYLNPLAKKHHFTYYVKSIHYFNEIDTVSISVEEAQRGYENCSRIKDTCSIFNGYYYKCMRPKTTNLYLEKKHDIKLEKDLRVEDGVKISGEDFRKRLDAYIADANMLESCKYCLMGMESDQTVIEVLKHKALKNPILIKVFYKNNFIYHTYKSLRRAKQFDEGAHTCDDGIITTSVHQVEEKVTDIKKQS